MSVRKAVSSLSIILILPLVFSSAAFAQKKKTVGDLLKKIERDAERTQLKRKRSNLPSVQRARIEQRPTVNLKAVKPPATSKLYYAEGSDEAELMRSTDDAIRQLYKLTQRYKKSTKRGELWLRLAEQYVEKAKLIEYQLQNKYDADMQRFLAKKTKARPKLNLKPAQDYNKKAIQLYEWFVRDFPKDEKLDQALYFLGFNHFEIGNLKKGEEFYLQLTKQFPRSPYVAESNFALAEFYFENEKWEPAMGFYMKVVKDRSSRLNTLATYKTGWCLYKLNNTKKGIQFLEKVITDGRRSKSETDSKANKIRLAKEAIKDLILFYSEVGDPNNAFDYFADIVGPKSARAQVAKLGSYYLDTGNRNGARVIFKKLIAEDSTDPNAFEYQTKIVNLYQTAKDQVEFRKELYEWVQDYGPGGRWQEANEKNEKLITEANEKMEFTLRNYILAQHQAAQNSRAKSSQARAIEGYALYFDTFKKSAKLDEMHFFFGELLFDMGEYQKATAQYAWVMENAPKGEYAEKSTMNILLALEKQLPKPEEIKKMVGDSTDPIPFTKEISLFEDAAVRYFKQNPNGDNVPAIKYRVGSLHYYFNHFDQALDYFNEIVKKYPKTEFAQYSANLILDIYNLKKDYQGLQAAAQNILSVPELAKSDVGTQIETIKVQTDFKLAKELEDSQKFSEAAEQYKAFAIANKTNPLSITAVYNAGINYERAENLAAAIPMYEAVAASKAAKDKSLVFNSAKFLPPLYEKLGQYEKAANAFESFAKSNPKDELSIEYRYNAAIIFDALNENSNAIRNFKVYSEEKKGAERFEALFLLAKLYERLKSYDLALRYYDQYMNSGTVNASGVVEAAFSIAQIHSRRGKKKFADEWYDKTVVTQKALARKGKIVGQAFAAEAKFNLVSDTYKELVRIKIPQSTAAQGKAFEKKLAMLNRLKEELKGVIAYDDGFQIVAALNMQGQALYHMYSSLMNAPKPKGMTAEETKQYNEGIAGIANPFKDQAVETLQLAVKRGHELQAYNDSLVEAIDRLSELSGDKTKDVDAFVKIATLVDEMKVDWKGKREADILKDVAERLAKDSKDLYTLNGLGVYYMQNNKPGLAKIIFNRALEHHKKEPALYNNLGVLYLRDLDMRGALESFSKSLGFGRYRYGAINLSSIYLKHKDYERSLSPLKSAYSDVKADLGRGDQNAVAIANNYAVALMGTDSGKKADDVFETILKSGNRDAEVHLNYAILLIEILNKKIDGQRILSKIQFMTEDPKILKRAQELEKHATQN